MLNFGSLYVALNVSKYSVDVIMIGNVKLRITRSVYVATDATYKSLHGRPVKSQPG
jgi:hypothetical protein